MPDHHPHNDHHPDSDYSGWNHAQHPWCCVRGQFLRIFPTDCDVCGLPWPCPDAPKDTTP